MGNPNGLTAPVANEEKAPQPLGHFRVRTSFNPSANSYVDQIKQKGAELINLINEAANNPEWNDRTLQEWKRLKALAMTDIESGTSWAVKAATI